MTRDVFIKADGIYKKIEDLKSLRRIANRPYKKFRLSRKFLWISDFTEDNITLCDKGLTNLIEEYCDKRIVELQEELNRL